MSAPRYYGPPFRDHVRDLRHIRNWDAFVATCSCGWEGAPRQYRPEAVRDHTVHVVVVGRVQS